MIRKFTMKKILYTAFLFAFILFLGCSTDSSSSFDPGTGGGDPPDEIPELTDEVEAYEPDIIHDNYVFAIENGGTKSYLLNKAGEKVYEWEFDINLGNDVELMPDGKLLGMFKSENPQITAGGFGGIVRIYGFEGSLLWEYEYNTFDYIAHHDVELLDNGNVLIMVWERIDVTTAQNNGIETTVDIIPEKLIEVNISTNEIVWEWRAWDHIVQESDPGKPNYGVVADNPHLINLNYTAGDVGDITHANGIDVDEVNDLIYLSVNFFDEVWVIDHSTTTAEAASSSGGNYGKGGDLVYRFGNPRAYNNMEGNVLFDRNHFPNLLENGEPGSGNLLIYVNGNSVSQSTVYELDLPDTFNLQPNTNNEPTAIWSFVHPDLYHGRLSGATRLSNGNTLICEGDYGYWEVTPNNEVAWKYNGASATGGNFWRGYAYDKDHPAIIALGLSN